MATVKSLEKRIDELEARLVKVEPVVFEREPYQNMSAKAKAEAMAREAEEAK